MYWEKDTEESRKLKREEQLRKKKGLPIEDAPKATSSTDLSVLIALLEQQTQVASEQNKRISELSKSIEEQKELIGSLCDKESVPTKILVTSENSREIPILEATSEVTKFTKLDDIDVNIIDTSGIEAVGESAGVVTTGQNISNQIEKLKKLRKKG